ncbi:MAG: S8 family serine peptidase [Bacilli bacterium]
MSAVDIAAAGTVYTTKANETLGNVSGTSLAAPTVSSAAILMLSYSKEKHGRFEQRRTPCKIYTPNSAKKLILGITALKYATPYL